MAGGCALEGPCADNAWNSAPIVKSTRAKIGTCLLEGVRQSVIVARMNDKHSAQCATFTDAANRRGLSRAIPFQVVSFRLDLLAWSPGYTEFLPRIQLTVTFPVRYSSILSKDLILRGSSPKVYSNSLTPTRAILLIGIHLACFAHRTRPVVQAPLSPSPREPELVIEIKHAAQSSTTIETFGLLPERFIPGARIH